jgi:hypothetical protein
MRTPCESDASAKVRCMGPQGSNIATGYGSKTAGVIFRGCAYDRVGRCHAVSVGEMIDSSRPQSNELTTLYVVDISEDALPFGEKVSPNTLFAPLHCASAAVGAPQAPASGAARRPARAGTGVQSFLVW